MNAYTPGERIANRYEVVGQPLKGGMGIVYVCFDHQEGRPVALDLPIEIPAQPGR